jgi:8-amino-7-oxononanoate synthase
VHEAERLRFSGLKGLYFGSGFAANVAPFSSLPQRDDLIVHDVLIHPSARDVISASKAKAAALPHNDVYADYLDNDAAHAENPKGLP